MNNIIITLEDGTKKEYRNGVKLQEIIDDLGLDETVICGRFNNIVVNMIEYCLKEGLTS